MTRRSLHRKLTTGAALMLAAVPVAIAVRELFKDSGATALFAGGGAIAATALERRSGVEIRGNLTRPLAPGVSRPLNLTLTNPHPFGLTIQRLTVAVSVDARHAAAGCRVAPNFKVTRLAKRAYPLHLPPRHTRTLPALGVKRLPRVAMRNLPINQDACKGAQLEFRYTGQSRRGRRDHAR